LSLFIDVKYINTGDIWLQFKKYEKNLPDGAAVQKYLKTMISPLLTRPPECQGCQKNPEDQTKDFLVSWSTKIQPKLNRTFRKQGFFDNITFVQF
jgi:hypothetical protein